MVMHRYGESSRVTCLLREVAVRVFPKAWLGAKPVPAPHDPLIQHTGKAVARRYNTHRPCGRHGQSLARFTAKTSTPGSATQLRSAPADMVVSPAKILTVQGSAAPSRPVTVQ